MATIGLEGWLPALATAAGLLSSSAAAQDVTLDGHVHHAGIGVPFADVIAVHLGTNAHRGTTTNPLGYFRLLALSPGRYAVTARSPGYAPVTEVVELIIGQRASLSLALQRQPTRLDTVVVQPERAGRSDVQRLTVSTAVVEEDIRQLPLNARTVMDLASVAPGIRSLGHAAGRTMPAAGALRDERFLNLYVDGMEMKSLYDGNLVGLTQAGSPLPVDALQEFRVLLNPYDAEYTRGAAYVLSAVTRRGTNETRGTAFLHHQSQSFISVNDFQRAIPNFERPDYRRLQAGASLRGPVVTDRLFYAGTYEVSDAVRYLVVNPGRPASDPAHWDAYAGLFPAPTRNHHGVLRLTYAPDQASTLDAIWTTRHLRGEGLFGGMTAHEAAAVHRTAVNTLNLRHRWVPTARLANDLSLQVVSWSQRDRPLVPGPELRYPTLIIGRGGSRFFIDETHVRLLDRVTWSSGSGPGSHLAKAGIEIGRVRARQHFGINANGVFRFLDIGPEANDATISIGIIDPYSDRDASASASGWVVGAYVNDEWRPTSRLVLSLGVRYDAELNTLNNRFRVPWASDPVLAALPEMHGLLNDGRRRNDLDNVSPRVAFRWDVTGTQRAYLRGGAGIVHDRVPSFLGFQERSAATWRTYVITDPGTLDTEELRERVLAGGGRVVPPSITLLPQRMHAPENRQWSLGVGVQLSPALSFNSDYVEHHVRRLFAEVNLNWLDVTQNPPRRVLTGDYGNIVAWGDFTRARYRALLSHLAYEPDERIRVSLAHTLGWAIADWDVANAAVPAPVAPSFYTMQRISGDERHRFVLMGRTVTPVGGTISTVATVASPRPYRTWIGEDVNGNNFLQDDWIDGRRYQLPGNSWRHWYRVVDVRVTQPVSIGRIRVSAVAEAFNLFNTVNYTAYSGVQRSASGVPQPDFGTPRDVLATRQFQLGMRAEF